MDGDGDGDVDADVDVGVSAHVTKDDTHQRRVRRHTALSATHQIFVSWT